MNKLVNFVTSMAILLIVAAVVVTLGLCLGLNIHDWNLTKQAIVENVNCILGEDAKSAYALLQADDWEGFTQHYGLRSTYYTVGDYCYVSLATDRLDGATVIHAGPSRNPLVTALSFENGSHWESINPSEPFTIAVTVSGHKINFTATGAAALCQHLSQIIANDAIIPSTNSSN